MPRNANDPVQEQLIAARRSQILDAATTVFAAKGFSRATIRDVAQEAGIADGTIYIYFKNKTALLLGLLDRINETERRDEDLAQANDMDLRAFTKAYLEQRYNLFDREGLDVFRAVLPEVMMNADLRVPYMREVIEPSYALAEKHFATLMETGRLRPLNVTLTIRAISAMTLGILMLAILEDPVVLDHWNELPEVLTNLTLDGILPDDE